jgi:hypothetical protein
MAESTGILAKKLNKISNTFNKSREEIFTDSSHISPIPQGSLQIWLVVITVTMPTREDTAGNIALVSRNWN